jgi:hypothetical protein
VVYPVAVHMRDKQGPTFWLALYAHFASLTFHIKHSIDLLSISVVVLISLLVPALVIRIFHVIAKLLHPVSHVIPLVLNILRYILNLLNLLAGPFRCVFWEVLNVVNGVIPLLLYVIAKVLCASDLLSSPSCGILGEVANVVAELVDFVRNVRFGAVPAVFCKAELVGWWNGVQNPVTTHQSCRPRASAVHRLQDRLHRLRHTSSHYRRSSFPLDRHCE